MKSFKLIALSAILSVGALSSVVYTSCSKDKCKDVTCQNGGTCSDGNCTCVTGSGGTNCETIYRTGYANTYVGTGTDNGTPVFTYTNWRFTFSTSSSSSDLISMNLAITDASGGSVDIPVLPIKLSEITATGSKFTIQATTATSGDVYTGSGTISGTSGSIIFTQTPSSGTPITYTFTTLNKS